MTAKGVRRLGLVVAQLATVLAFLFLWQIASDHNLISPIYFSKPTVIWDQLKVWFSTGTIWGNIGNTVEVFIVGYVIGTVLGTVAGVVIGTVQWFRQVTEPFLAFFNATPRLILLPLLIVWFGFGVSPKIVLVVAVIVVMVTLNVSAGVQGVREDLLNNARIMGASRWALIRDVYVPSVVIWIMSTARVTVGYAFNATIAAEFIGAAKGLGYLMYLGQADFHVEQIYAALLITAVIAFIMDILLAAVEHRSTKWMRVG